MAKTKEDGISFNELARISSDLNRLIDISDKTKFKRKVLYGVYKNLEKCRNEMETIRKQFKMPDEKYTEYIEKLIDLAEKHGAEVKRDNNGNRYIENEEVRKLGDEYKEASKELEKEYDKAIKKQEKINKENEDLLSDPLASPTWYKIALDEFPEEVSSAELPISLVLFGIVVE